MQINLEYLQPEKIGISLNDNFLMSPIKSVTGVLVDGKKEIHIFETNFPFCSSCKHHSCRERMKNIVSQIDKKNFNFQIS